MSVFASTRRVAVILTLGLILVGSLLIARRRADAPSASVVSRERTERVLCGDDTACMDALRRLPRRVAATVDDQVGFASTSFQRVDRPVVFDTYHAVAVIGSGSQFATAVDDIADWIDAHIGQDGVCRDDRTGGSELMVTAMCVSVMRALDPLFECGEATRRFALAALEVLERQAASSSSLNNVQRLDLLALVDLLVASKHPDKVAIDATRRIAALASSTLGPQYDPIDAALVDALWSYLDRAIQARWQSVADQSVRNPAFLAPSLRDAERLFSIWLRAHKGELSGEVARNYWVRHDPLITSTEYPNGGELWQRDPADASVVVQVRRKNLGQATVSIGDAVDADRVLGGWARVPLMRPDVQATAGIVALLDTINAWPEYRAGVRRYATVTMRAACETRDVATLADAVVLWKAMDAADEHLIRREELEPRPPECDSALLAAERGVGELSRADAQAELLRSDLNAPRQGADRSALVRSLVASRSAALGGGSASALLFAQLAMTYGEVDEARAALTALVTLIRGELANPDQRQACRNVGVLAAAFQPPLATLRNEADDMALGRMALDRCLFVEGAPRYTVRGGGTDVGALVVIARTLAARESLSGPH